MGVSPCCVVANVLDWNIVAREFEFLSHLVHFWTNTFRKDLVWFGFMEYQPLYVI